MSSDRPLSAEIVTKEGVRVEIGQVWRDLDPRQAGRTVAILHFVCTKPGEEKVRVRTSNGAETTISVRRMYRHGTGYELLK